MWQMLMITVIKEDEEWRQIIAPISASTSNDGPDHHNHHWEAIYISQENSLYDFT